MSDEIEWTTVTLKPGLHQKAGEQTEWLGSTDGRVLLAVQPNRAVLYRNIEGDFVCVADVNLTGAVQ